MKKQMRQLIYIITAISLVVCAVIGGLRLQTEQNYRDVQIAVRYNDMLRIARNTERSLEDVLREFRELGATTLLARENTVASASDTDLYTYRGQGKVILLEGYILKFYYPEVIDIRPEHRYLVIEDLAVVENIYNSYTQKGIEVEPFEYEGTYFIDTDHFSGELSTIGVGFNVEDLNLAASLGYSISPQIKSWTEPTEASLVYLVNHLEQINNLGTIYFADTQVPGADTEAMAEFARNHQIGFIEFTTNKQKGFGALAKASSEAGTNYKVVRLHTLGDSQVKTYSLRETMERFELALKERNNRAFLFKMANTVDEEEDEAFLKESIVAFKELVEKDGYTVTADGEGYNLPPISPIMAVIAGLGAIMVFILLLVELNLVKLGYILATLGFIGYVALLKVSPNLGSKLMALFGAIIFPTYGVVKGIQDQPRDMKDTVLSFLKICAISYGGVLTILGTLSRTSFGLGIDLFAGVKLAHIIPIVIILGILVYKKHKISLSYINELLNKKISYGAVILIGIIAVALYIYTTRTGNSGSASELELAFRQLLDNILGVRPRTKEFLIGYPILIAILHYGYKERYLPLMIFAAIGPISLVNTYAHIHTPVLISIIRSVYGILIGLVIGLILIWCIKQLGRVIQRCQAHKK